jgi:hypothetical protein
MSDPTYPPTPLDPQAPVHEPERERPTATILAVVLIAILSVVLLLLVFGGDDGDPGASASPSASVSASGSAAPAASIPPSEAASPGDGSAAPSAPAPGASAPASAVSPPEGILPVGSTVEVAADGLRLREEPTTGAAEVATLAAGEVLYLFSGPTDLGPVEADGYSWYLAMYTPGYRDWPLNPPGSGDGPSGDPRLSGWFAANAGSEAYVELLPARCPVSTDIDGLYAATAWERLACLGEQQLTVEGTYGCSGCGGLAPGSFEPDWLAAPNFHIFTPSWADLPPVVEQMVLHVPPDVAELGSEQAGSVLRVTGHFNDPRSTECAITAGEGGEVPANDLAAEWYCRLGFVVESWEVVGTDPDWQGG